MRHFTRTPCKFPECIAAGNSNILVQQMVMLCQKNQYTIIIWNGCSLGQQEAHYFGRKLHVSGVKRSRAQMWVCALCTTSNSKVTKQTYASTEAIPNDSLRSMLYGLRSMLRNVYPITVCTCSTLSTTYVIHCSCQRYYARDMEFFRSTHVTFCLYTRRTQTHTTQNPLHSNMR